MPAARILQGPFTVDDYYRMAECGILRWNDRTELIDGQVVPMTPIGVRHASRLIYLTDVLGKLAGPDTLLIVQNPVRLETRSEPQPDITVVRRRPDYYGRAHPTPADTLLVIEVADSSIEYDRDVKVPLYARTGIPEVWLCDLPGDRVEVYRDPGAGGYRSVRKLRPGETLTTPGLPGVELPVTDVLGLSR
jgi:Uma2 family endonuclease